MASEILESDTWQTALSFHYTRDFVSMICSAEFEQHRNVAASGRMDDLDFFPLLRSKLLTYGSNRL